MIGEQIPNFLRVAPNPWVAQTCWSLSRCVREAWPETDAAGRGDYCVFLCNSEEEALSGAIKLARFTRHRSGEGTTRTAGSATRDGRVAIVDPDGAWMHFSESRLSTGERVEYLPGIERIEGLSLDTQSPAGWPEILVLSGAAVASLTTQQAEWLQSHAAGGDRILILCAEPSQLATLRNDSSHLLRRLSPDVVVFGDAFTGREVPFGAFAARPDFYDPWMRKGLSQFHSTTFQPNTVSTLHFMECLREFDPAFVREHATELRRLRTDPDFLHDVSSRLFSPQLAKLARRIGSHRAPVRASGHYFTIGGKRVFDGVAGVACSIRGHNPPSYIDEIRSLEASSDADACRSETGERLASLTGLPWHVPAVSGAAAVEQGLKLGLCAQFPRKHILALRGGFGGKTLLALTGTSKAFYKQGLDPLYPSVSYVDPFAGDAVAQIEAVLRQYPVAVVLLELVQGVGGVRDVPEDVVRLLRERRDAAGYLLFVDEIQTGMFRTGPFVRSRAVGLTPDLVTIGKGASDMMFPFGFTLYSDRVRQRLDGRCDSLLARWHDRYGYLHGYQTVLNTLRRAESQGLADRVSEAGEQLARQLRRSLAGCPRVAEVRTFGLLCGIELDHRRAPERWLGAAAAQLVLLRMLQHPTFPLLMGYCQYEPHVLKLTPPLSITDDEIDRLAEAIGETLNGSFVRTLAAAAGSWMNGRFGSNRVLEPGGTLP